MRIGRLLGLLALSSTLALGPVGCGDSNPPAGGKMDTGKMDGGKMDTGKMDGGKMGTGKMEEGKMDEGKMAPPKS